MKSRTAMALTVLALIAAVTAGCTAAGGVPGAKVPSNVPDGSPAGTARVEGAVQRISVDVSQGYYVPTIIEAKAGVPLEITFGPGQGCTSAILIKQFGVNQDITKGAVIELPAMKPGEYEFSCGMEMVFGKIVVR